MPPCGCYLCVQRAIAARDEAVMPNAVLEMGDSAADWATFVGRAWAQGFPKRYVWQRLAAKLRTSPVTLPSPVLLSPAMVKLLVEERLALWREILDALYAED